MTIKKAQRARSVLLIQSSADNYGSDRVCLEVALAAIEHGYDVLVAVPSTGPLTDSFFARSIPYILLDGLIVRRADFRGLRALKTILQVPHRLLRLRHFARTRRFDLVHSNCSVTLGGVYLASRWRVPHVWHVHEFLPKNPASALMERLLLTADAVITCSQSVAEQFTSAELRRKCRIAHSGARVRKADGSTRPAFRNGRIELVCIGRLNAWKGQRILIQAIEILRQAGYDVHLRLVGDPYKGQNHFRVQLLEQIAAAGLSDHVALDGFRSDVGAILAEADAVVVPSERPEPFGLVVVEAMAQGRPVIATKPGGPGEVISSGVDGILIEPGSPKAIANAVVKLANNPKWANTMGERARATAASYTPERMARVVLDAYDQLLEEPNMDAFDGQTRWQAQ